MNPRAVIPVHIAPDDDQVAVLNLRVHAVSTDFYRDRVRRVNVALDVVRDHADRAAIGIRAEARGDRLEDRHEPQAALRQQLGGVFASDQVIDRDAEVVRDPLELVGARLLLPCLPLGAEASREAEVGEDARYGHAALLAEIKDILYTFIHSIAPLFMV